MTEPVHLNKKVEPKNFEFLLGATNHFYDRILRALFLALLFIFDFVMFVYSINGRVLENGVANEAILYIAGGFGVVFLVLMLLLSFSGVAQNIVCALFTLLITLLYLEQFALFDISNFIELWLEDHAESLTFIGAIPSNWLVGLTLALIVFFAFKMSFIILLAVLLIAGSLGIAMYQTEMSPVDKKEYNRVKELTVMQEDARHNNIVYLMAPKLPSYHFLSTIKDVHFRELRDMMLGFYAVNDFEVYPNAFVQKNDTVSNIVDIYNLVDYRSSSSGIRGYAEILNDWDFAHGTLDTMALEDNKLYEALANEGYKTSTYPMPRFNFCYKGNNMFTDRCVVKQTQLVSLYDKKSSLEKNIFALLGEWVLGFHISELKSVAKMLMDMSHLKGMRIISENRRLSIEGAPVIFDELYNDFAKDKNGVVYVAFAELPSDLYIYDEYCNLKPRKEWVSLKDNTLYSGGIDLKRKAYTDQAKCFLGMTQMFMEKLYQNEKQHNTDIIVQGVSVLRELAGMPAGRYGTFVADKLVNLGIRRASAPSFVVNTEICLASDVVRSHLLGEKFCYTVDDMKMTTEETLNLKQNLINNSILRGSKISNIAADYRDWYDEFRKNSPYYQKWREQIAEISLSEQQGQPAIQETGARQVVMPEAVATTEQGFVDKYGLPRVEVAPTIEVDPLAEEPVGHVEGSVSDVEEEQPVEQQLHEQEVETTVDVMTEQVSEVVDTHPEIVNEQLQITEQFVEENMQPVETQDEMAMNNANAATAEPENALEETVEKPSQEGLITSEVVQEEFKSVEYSTEEDEKKEASETVENVEQNVDVELQVEESPISAE